MKKLFALLYFTGFCSLLLQAQNKLTPVFNMWFLTTDGNNYKHHAGAGVDIDLTYLNHENAVIATEFFSDTVGAGSHIALPIGEGVNQNPSPFPRNFFKDVTRVHATGTLHDRGNDIPFDVFRDFRYTTAALIAECANGIGEFKFDPLANETFKSLFDPATGIQNYLVNMKWDTSSSPPVTILSRFPLDNEVRRVTRLSAFDDTPVNMYEFPPKEWRPMSFGTVDKVEGWVTSIIPKTANNLWNGVVIKMSDLFGRSTDPHSTAAIYGDNTANEMGTGIYGKGQTWGLYGSGQNGAVGITSGELNGSGLTAFVGAAPAAGGFKYGMYANSNSQPGSWAVGVFGSGFYTGTWMMSSDERLKNNIQPQTHALARVMQLKPSSYEYNTDMPYGFAAGLHHGFIAQDVEKVFPELVSDIIMPKDTDPEKMYKSPVETYKGINYTEMISILTSALQELNTSLNEKIDAQAAEIAELKKLIQH